MSATALAQAASKASQSKTVKEVRDLGSERYDFVGLKGKRIRIGLVDDGDAILMYSPDSGYAQRKYPAATGRDELSRAIVSGLSEINPDAAGDSGPVWKRLGPGIYQTEGKGGDWFIERGDWGNGYPWAIGRRYGYGMMLPDAYFKTLAQARKWVR